MRCKMPSQSCVFKRETERNLFTNPTLFEMELFAFCGMRSRLEVANYCDKELPLIYGDRPGPFSA